ncbi:MAG: DUF924 domain-containing protein [Alphaproteobacteria bacterium]|nr:DUF924 domain-containing protein [Alphaproteobacteria bacterium]
MSAAALTAEDVLNFWFFELGEGQWFKPDAAVDEKIRHKFQSFYDDALNGNLREWEKTPTGTLALLLFLSAFPRRMFAGTAKAFETDAQALELARTAIIRHFDDRIDASFKLFFYLPFMYSENLGDQRLALFYIRERTKNPSWLAIAEDHFLLIQKYGRFPERNTVLKRASTPLEAAYLQENHRQVA